MYSVPAVLSYNFSPRAPSLVYNIIGGDALAHLRGRAGPRTTAGPTPPTARPGGNPGPKAKMAEMDTSDEHLFFLVR